MGKEQELIEVKRAWDEIGNIVEEQMIYFEMHTQKKLEKAISTLDKFIYKQK